MGCSPTRLLDDGPSGTTSHRLIFPLGLSSMPALPVLRAKPPLLRTLRFHSPKVDFQINSTCRFADHRADPCHAHSKVSDVFEISRVRTRAS